MAMIECENLVKIYKTDEIEVMALQGLDLVVEDGEFMALMGKSGSGKDVYKRQFLFRAKGDAVIRRRRVFELKLCALARKHMLAGEVEKAREVLATPFDEAYRTLRAELFTLAEILFETNGIQLDVEHFHGAAPERGAVLETIDLPITNRTYYACLLYTSISLSEMLSSLRRML